MNIFSLDPFEPHSELLARAAALLAAGSLAVLPTDTVYGLGMAALQDARPDALYHLKGRPFDKPIPLLLADVEDITRYGKAISRPALRLAEKHWPGALTLVVWASEALPPAFRARDGSVALRVADSPIVRALARMLGSPLAVTSANRSGEASVRRIEDIDPALAQAVDLIIDAGPAPLGEESTVVSCLEGSPQLLRQGAIGI
ncbi:MAG: threonylcarbamoyl-AMP synthase [Coriobacteriales bacterium]|jgi:tRNA threonylcarbamoyl adenosine modification protein (Sua5/YciO/YrdC/YwlC family)|nr:threonylcarbamoyl-AMP synthase [Coriobacteriales bacterium]